MRRAAEGVGVRGSETPQRRAHRVGPAEVASGVEHGTLKPYTLNPQP
jgi:hypothetical protein